MLRVDAMMPRTQERNWLEWNVLAPGALVLSRGEILWRWYRTVVSNWWNIAPLLILPKSKVEIRFTDGTSVECSTPSDWQRFQNAVRLRLLRRFLGARATSYARANETPRSVLEFEVGGRTVRFRFEESPEEIAFPISEIFLMGEYSTLEVAGRQVVDIGAHWADSAIYFVAHGAREVLGYEASPSVFRRGTENVDLNGLNRTVSLRLAACGAESGRFRVRDDGPTSGTWRARESDGGTWVERTTLEEIVATSSLSKAALKVDCEGCEYDLFQCDRSAFDPFDEVVIEYHNGSRAIVKALLDAGFAHVRCSRPMRLPREMIAEQDLFGIVHASRSDDG